MEASYNTKSIILSRQDFRENDVLVVFFNKEKGVFSLIARGAKKKTSKLAGHIEPLNFVDLMTIKGRQYDYVGSIKNIETFSKIKNNLDKLETSLEILKTYKKFIKEGESENELFLLLYNSLLAINSNKLNLDLFYNIFLLKFLSLLGFSIELNTCLKCRRKIIPKNNYINMSRGGLFCSVCRTSSDLTISDDCIKMLKLANSIEIEKVANIKINRIIQLEFDKIVSSFHSYCSY